MDIFKIKIWKDSLNTFNIKPQTLIHIILDGVCHFENFYYINLYFVVVHFGKHGVL